MQGYVINLVAGCLGVLSGIYLAHHWRSRLLIKHIAELDSLDTQEDREALFEYLCDQVGGGSDASGRGIRDLAISVLRQVLHFGPAVAFICGAAYLPIPFWSSILLFGAVCVPLQMIVVLWVQKRRIRELARGYILLQGKPMCLNCGYDLRGQDVPRCPECGTECDARVKGIMRLAQMKKERCGKTKR